LIFVAFVPIHPATGLEHGGAKLATAEAQKVFGG